MKRVMAIHRRLIALTLIMSIIFSIIIMLLLNHEVIATSNRYEYNGNNLNTSLYPGYKEKLDALNKSHPNWDFIIMETGLDWNQTIIGESGISGNSPLSLIQNRTGAWICATCGGKKYDNGTWSHASEDAIKYYMDPRNWLEDDSSAIFQFLQIGWKESSDQDVYNAIKGSFLDKDGQGWENACAINRASREGNANPFYIIARLLQEQGKDGGSTWRMSSGEKYYYNLFNINAGGNSNSEIIANALKYAKNHGWDSIEKCIKDSIKILLSDYINAKQDTLYLNKFDVETYGGLYHQYMQNIEAPKAEAYIMYSKIKDTGILNQKLTFVIPVFTGMPSTPCVSPGNMAVDKGPVNIRVKQGHSDVNVRAERDRYSKLIATVPNSDSIILSVERYGGGWHKVVLEDGKIGYILFNNSYLEQINDITNCDEKMLVTSDGINLRVGPGMSQTIITTLTYGQQITRIDNTGRYNIDGKVWDRVRLSDGRQGFVSREYIKTIDSSDEVYTVRADGGLFIHREEGVRSPIRLLDDGLKVTRIGIATKEISGYYWDKVVTPDGVVGYVARAYLRDNNGNVPSGKNEEVPLSKTKKDEDKKYIYAEANVSVETLRTDYGNDIKITNSNNENIEGGIVGTGYSVTMNKKEYKIVKLGDLNGDGYINTGDTYLMKLVIQELRKLDGAYKSASDINNDGNINTGDSFVLKKHIKEVSMITIQ